MKSVFVMGLTIASAKVGEECSKWDTSLCDFDTECCGLAIIDDNYPNNEATEEELEICNVKGDTVFKVPENYN